MYATYGVMRDSLDLAINENTIYVYEFYCYQSSARIVSIEILVKNNIKASLYLPVISLFFIYFSMTYRLGH